MLQLRCITIFQCYSFLQLILMFVSSYTYILTLPCRYKSLFFPRDISCLFKVLEANKITHIHSHLFNSPEHPSSDWVNIEVAAVKVGSRHGSVIPVLAENPNHPEEQSAVVMCWQSLKTNLSSPALTSAPLTNTGLSPAQDRAGRQRRRQAGRKDETLELSLWWCEYKPEHLCQKGAFSNCQCCTTLQEDIIMFRKSCSSI